MHYGHRFVYVFNIHTHVYIFSVGSYIHTRVRACMRACVCVCVCVYSHRTYIFIPPDPLPLVFHLILTFYTVVTTVDHIWW